MIAWANASLQNLYAGMIWMGNNNRIALHKVDKHFQEAKRVLKQYEYALYKSKEQLKTTRHLMLRSMKVSPGFMLKNILLQPFWIRMGLLGAATLLLGGLLFSRGSSKVSMMSKYLTLLCLSCWLLVACDKECDMEITAYRLKDPQPLTIIYLRECFWSTRLSHKMIWLISMLS